MYSVYMNLSFFHSSASFFFVQQYVSAIMIREKTTYPPTNAEKTTVSVRAHVLSEPAMFRRGGGEGGGDESS